MECFIKKVFLHKADEASHQQFVRFGKGVYSGRAALSLTKNSRVKLKGSFEYANDFVLLSLEFWEANYSGIIMSKEPLGLENEKNKKDLFIYEVKNLSGKKISELKDKTYYLLLDGEGSGISLKIKKKLPKPGKSGASKIDDTFCVLEADLKYYDKIREGFLWDIPDCKKCKVQHIYKITSLEMPKDEEDFKTSRLKNLDDHQKSEIFEKIRLMTKRKGKIIRKLEVDGQTQTREFEFEA